MSRNKIEIDGCVQKDPKLLSEIASFNISAITGEYQCIDNTIKNRFTYIRVIFPNEEGVDLTDLVQPGSMVRIYGKLDSEQYVTSAQKIVYNKVICAYKIVRIKYNKDICDYVEVI